MDDKHFDDEIHEYIALDKKLKVLVVDDSVSIRNAISERLRMGGLVVEEASDGKEALEKVNQEVPDIILLDIVMPVLDGLSVLKTLRETYSKLQLPIILVTSRDSKSDLIEALDLGANDYVTKPVDFDLLWARLTNQLMQKKASEYLATAKQELTEEVKKRTLELHESNKNLKLEMQAKLAVEEELKKQASFDALTGLPNRRLAQDRIQQMLAKAKRLFLKPSIVFIDLDNFKYVNDTLGHAAGDDLLKQASERLLRCTRDSDTVARLGGDEFLLILDEIGNESISPRELDLKIIGERILEEYAKPFTLDGVDVNISPSIGFAVFPRDGEDSETLMRNADAAMYQSKNNGKNTFCFYSPQMTSEAKVRIEMEAKLRKALNNNEFSLVYQPIIEASNGSIVKAEALLRWNNSDLGSVAPDVFIPVAEEIGAIVDIGKWVIDSVCKQLREWLALGNEAITVTINVSARQFHKDCNVYEIVESALERFDLQPKAIQLEVTEGVLIKETEHFIDVMNALEKKGIKLLIDDFGTGYASLAYLQKYNFDALKIDRSYINKVLESEKDAVLVKAVIAMAHSLGLSVVSEGVETVEQVAFLTEINCQYMQGYYFSPPVSASDFNDLRKSYLKGKSIKLVAKS